MTNLSQKTTVRRPVESALPGIAIGTEAANVAEMTAVARLSQVGWPGEDELRVLQLQLGLEADLDQPGRSIPNLAEAAAGGSVDWPLVEHIGRSRYIDCPRAPF
jgi:hypothetical protein